MIHWTHFKKCPRYNEHNIPVWPNKTLVYLPLNIICSLKLRVFLSSCPALTSFFGTDNVLCPQFVIDWPSMGGVVDVASTSAFVVFPLFQHVSKVRFQPNNTLPRVQNSNYNWLKLPGQGVAVNSRGFRSGKIHEEIVKSLFRCSGIGASSMDGTTASLLSKKQQKKRTVPVRHKEIPKAKLWQLSVSPSLVMKNPKTSCTAFNYHKR